MDDVVERVMASYENWERLGREEIRVKVTLKNLPTMALAYLRILHEGPDPRYSGCLEVTSA
jgi:hypothetical protein